MRIVRYTLEIVGYQQLQPLWPGRILSVGACPPYDDKGGEKPLDDPRRYRIDMWALDNSEAPAQANVNGPRLPPVLGVWIIGTGEPMPTSDPHFAEAIFHGTVDMRHQGGLGRAGAGAWHVFTAVIGVAEDPRRQPEHYNSVDDMAEQIRARHARRADHAE